MDILLRDGFRSRNKLGAAITTWPILLGAIAIFGCSIACGAERPVREVLAITNVPYKSGLSISEYEKNRCQLDLYLPKQATNFPTLVWFHGGGLTAGAKDEAFNVKIAERFAQAGVAVAMANYRLSPAAGFPSYVEDAAAAFAWVRAHVSERGGDAGRVFVGGHSAGGYLTLMIGLDRQYLVKHGLDLGSIAGLIPVSGQTMTHYTVREERGLDKSVILADEAAPIHYARKDTPPLLVLYADGDLPARAEENIYLVAALRAAGNKQVESKQISGRDHGSIAGKISEAEDPAAEAILSFIESVGQSKVR